MTRPEEYAARREMVLAEAVAQGLDGVFAYSWRRSAVSWLTGYAPGYLSNAAALWLPVVGEPVLGVRFGFDRPRARMSGLRVVEAASLLGVLPDRISALGILASDQGMDELPIGVHDELIRRSPRVLDLSDSVARMQVTKTPAEIQRLRNAARVAGNALQAVDDRLIGCTDFEIAGLIEGQARRDGASRCLALVGVGDGAVITETTGVRVGVDDPVGLEVTLFIDGACMHVNRTIAPRPLREVDARAIRACHQTRNKLIRAMLPGVAVDDLVLAGDAVLAEHGLLLYKEYDFGHGLGVDTPELPKLILGTDEHIVENSVIAIHVAVRRPGGETAMVGGPVLVGATGTRELVSSVSSKSMDVGSAPAWMLGADL